MYPLKAIFCWVFYTPCSEYFLIVKSSSICLPCKQIFQTVLDYFPFLIFIIFDVFLSCLVLVHKLTAMWNLRGMCINTSTLEFHSKPLQFLVFGSLFLSSEPCWGSWPLQNPYVFPVECSSVLQGLVWFNWWFTF